MADKPDMSPVDSPAATGHRRFISIRAIVTTASVAIIAGAVVCVGMVGERQSRQALESEIQLRLLAESRNLALSGSSALMGDFPELTLLPQIRKMQENRAELSDVVVIDHGGRITGHSDPARIGTVRPELPDLVPLATRLTLSPGETLRRNSSLLVASAPIVEPGGRTIGMAIMELKQSYIDEIVGRTRAQQMLVLLLVLAAGVGAALLLMSWVLRPVGILKAGLERIGRGDLETSLDIRDVTEFGILADTVNGMTHQLKRAQSEMLEKERLSRELELAREIQNSLLPTRRSVAGNFVIEGSHEAAAEVGGDYFDVLPLSGGRIGIAMADVAGKGLGGCMVMSMLSALLRALKDSHDSPLELLVRLDERLSDSLRRGSFVTMFYGILDPATGSIVYASAGHCPTIVYRKAAGGIERLATRGIPLGAVRGGAIRRTLREESLTLEAGDMLLQYTDGYYETFEETGREQFGFERMEAILRQEAGRGATAVLEAERSALRGWRGAGPPQDDETLLIVSREVAVPVTSKPLSESDEALGWLAEARDRGRLIELRARREDLDRIPAWVATCPDLSELPARRTHVIATALYEACANIVEHGYGDDPDRSLRLWWVSPAGGAPGPASSNGGTALGYFLIHDQARAYSADDWKTTDFHNSVARKRGRGFGLDIIHKAVFPIVYRPSTPDGNVTKLVIERNGVDSEAKERHG